MSVEVTRLASGLVVVTDAGMCHCGSYGALVTIDEGIGDVDGPVGDTARRGAAT